jgi:rubrerythrin
MRAFKSLSEQEILALAISLEEEDARVYDDFADGLKDSHPAVAEQFRRLRADEDGHRHRLLDLYRQKFGAHIPLIRRHDVKGFVSRKPIWLVRPLGLDAVRKHAEVMELETKRFYERAARQATDAGVRQLLGDLAEEERKHEQTAEALEKVSDREDEKATQRRMFVLQVVQPGLAGLMDGSVSTLAPIFAAAFATRNSPNASWETFLVGLAASVGAGISMGFAEALSDDGSLTGRGRPWVRGVICGLMTALGGIGHTLPFLIPNVQTAIAVAIVVVAMELGVISWIRHRYMDTPLTSAVFQVVVGGVLVFVTGILIGSS